MTSGTPQSHSKDFLFTSVIRGAEKAKYDPLQNREGAARREQNHSLDFKSNSDFRNGGKNSIQSWREIPADAVLQCKRGNPLTEAASDPGVYEEAGGNCFHS